MAMVINNNMMAANTARILSNTYDRLSTSVQRLSSGLRINGAADDAAGLAIRELMRADIATMQQGIRNAADGISLLQTAEGGMAVIDEKLVRMKELAEQAATGTYTTVQREIINSEYQAMAAEIDRIATATNFNGVKLLDGSISAIHQGLGLKLHFGTGNNPAEDYYFINMGDVRATSQTGLRIGGDAKNDIWGTVGTHGGPNTTGCCGGGIPSLNEPVPGWREGEVFSFGYNWDWKAQNGSWYDNGVPELKMGRYIAGAWQVGSTPTLQELMDLVNQGSQARVRIDFEYKPAKFTLDIPGYPALDLTAYSAALSTNCGIDKNYRVAGDIEVVMSTSARPPSVCFVNGLYWPPASDFIFSASLYNTNGIGWVTASDGYAVRFSGFSAADLEAGRAPSYIVISAGGSAAVSFSAAGQYGSGFTFSGTTGLWYDASGAEARYSVTRPVEPEFTLVDGQRLPASLVEGNSVDGFRLKVGTWVVKTQAGGTTLADLLGRTSGANPAFHVSDVIADNSGNAQYKLTFDGASALNSAVAGGTYTSGSAVTAGVMRDLIAGLLDLGLITESPTSLQELVDAGFIAPNDGATGFSVAYVLQDDNGYYQYQLTASGAASAGGTATTGSAVTSAILNNLFTGIGVVGTPSPGDFDQLILGGYIVDRPGTPTTSPNPLFNLDYVIADSAGVHQWVLTDTGSAALSAGTLFVSGETITSAVLEAVLIELYGSSGATAFQQLITLGYIVRPTGSTFGSTQVGLTDYYGQPRNTSGVGTDVFNGNNIAGQLTDFFGHPQAAGDVFDPDNIAGLLDYFGNHQRVFDLLSIDGGSHRFCFGDYDVETYYIGSATLGASSFSDRTTAAAVSLSAALSNSAGPFGPGRTIEDVWAISALAYAINNNPNSQFWARLEGIGLEKGGEGQYLKGYTSLYVFAKDGGAKGNSLSGCDEQLGDIRGSVEQYNRAVWYNDEFETLVSAGTYFSNGGKDWGTLRAVPTGYGSWGVQLHGRDVGRYRDLWILNVGEAANSDIRTSQKDAFTGLGFGYNTATGLGISNLLGLDRASFVEVQNAADGDWAGAHVRTQSDAQEALDAIQGAIERKDKVRATLGAYINRLENTITNLEIQAENLQASESRISDVDLATEMTNFVRNQVLTQAAVSMLSQANSLPQMALSLLNG